MDGDLTKKVSEIMANPEFQSLVRELRGGEEMPDASEVSAKLPEVLSAFGPMLSGLMGTAGPGDPGAPKPAVDRAEAVSQSGTGRADRPCHVGDAVWGDAWRRRGQIRWR